MNADIQGLKKGIFWKTISTGINVLAGFAMSIVFARFLGKNDYGEWILVYTVIALFSMLSNFGLDKALQRFIPLYIKRKDEKNFTEFIVTASGLGMVFAALFSIIMFFTAGFISINIFHKPSLALYIRWAALYLFTFSLLSNIVFSIYHGFERWKEECLLNAAYLVASFLAIFIALSIFNKGIMEIIKIKAIISLIGIFGGIFYIARFIKLLKRSLKFEKFMPQIKKTLNFSTPMLMNGLLLYCIIHLDKIMVGRYRSAEELAQYYIAFALGTGILMFIKVAEAVLTPYLAKLTGENNAVLKSKFQTIFRLFLHLPIVFLIFFYFLIDPFIRIVYGSNFEIAATALKIYLIIIVLRSIMTAIGLFLVNVFGKTFEIAKIGFINSVVHLIFYSIFIPRYGYKGALATTIIAYIMIEVYVILFVKDINRLIPYKSLLYAGIGIIIVLGINLIANFYHIYNRWIFFIILPLIYSLFILSKGDIDLKKIRNAI